MRVLNKTLFIRSYVDDTNLYKVWKNVELLSNKYHWELLEYQTISFGKVFKLDPTKCYCIPIGKKVSMTYFNPIKHFLKKQNWVIKLSISNNITKRKRQKQRQQRQQQNSPKNKTKWINTPRDNLHDANK